MEHTGKFNLEKKMAPRGSQDAPRAPLGGPAAPQEVPGRPQETPRDGPRGPGRPLEALSRLPDPPLNCAKVKEHFARHCVGVGPASIQ